MIDIINIDTAQKSSDLIIKPNSNISGRTNDHKFYDTLQEQIKIDPINNKDNPYRIENINNKRRPNENNIENNNKIEKNKFKENKNTSTNESKGLEKKEKTEIKDTHNKSEELQKNKDKNLKNIDDKISDKDLNNIKEILLSLKQLIDLIKNIPEKNKELVEIEDSLKGLKNSFDELKLGKLKKILDKTFEKLHSLLKRIL